jgi:hypothetical protein
MVIHRVPEREAQRRAAGVPTRVVLKEGEELFDVLPGQEHSVPPVLAFTKVGQERNRLESRRKKGVKMALNHALKWGRNGAKQG